MTLSKALGLKQSKKIGFLLILLMTASISPVVAAGPAASVTASTAVAFKPVVLPHRATYRMSLDSVRNGSHVQAVEGDMVFEWSDACDGWNVEQRLNLSMTRDEGDELGIKSNYTTWESKAGTAYRFNYRNVVNGTVKDEFRGSAHLDGVGQKGTANYTVPTAKEIALPAGSYFPTAHTMALIEAAIAKKPIFSANVFDGTDEHGLSEVNSVIGTGRPIEIDAAKNGLGSTPNTSWPVRMAFFPYNEQEAVPDYEMDTTILPNGVSEFMLMDYGEFRLRGALEKVELLPKPDC